MYSLQICLSIHLDWLSILATARDDVGESCSMSFCVGHSPRSKQNSFKILCGLTQHRAHRYVDAAPGGVRDADVRARDQLLGVPKASRLGRRSEASAVEDGRGMAQELEVCTARVTSE